MRLQPLILLMALVYLAGCSGVPEKIRTPPPEAPTLSMVRQAPVATYLDAKVRWGGTIAKVENRQGETLVEIVSREMYRDGEPKQVDRSTGRFIARIGDFLDPAIYASGRRITVVGRISASIERELDQMSYRYPVVTVTAYHLWPQVHERNEYYDPWMYDPWYPWYPYDPWYPWRRYPYYY